MPTQSSFDRPDELRARMDAKTERTESGCVEWRGAMFTNGYGCVVVSGKLYGAHRVAWQLAHGPIGPGLCVCHRCDNRRCIRPDHLFLGTKGENAADRDQKGRTTRGEDITRAKLTDDDVRQIRAEYAARAGRRYGRTRVLALRFGVDESCIYAIVNRRTWRHVD